jgi:hypothetical protein
MRSVWRCSRKDMIRNDAVIVRGRCGLYPHAAGAI